MSSLPSALLTSAEMGRADHLTIATGTPGAALMDRAGAAVAVEAGRLLAEIEGGTVLVLCGPGNNGGDGAVAACRLRAGGTAARLALLGDVGRLTGDAAAAFAGWPDAPEDAASASFDGVALIVDALFGAGLTRPLTGQAGALVERIGASGLPVLAVDLPSGIGGDTGAAQGPAVRATATVTFFRLKPGHLLQPGRAHAGRVVLRDIGIAPAVLDVIAPSAFANTPRLWADAYPWPQTDGHKYTRGHAVVVSGEATTGGAARMSARAALRAGAGLVTLASPAEALAVNGAHLTAIMLRVANGPEGLAALLSDPRENAVVLGPGLGVGAATRALVRQALAPAPDGKPRGAVLDADALASFAGDASALASLVAGASGPVVATPHDGEFAKLFGPLERGASRLDRARAGARALQGVLLLKGPDTVVADASGRAAIATLDAPWLATAGSGDVLSGLIGGLLAQGMPAFEAACAAVYLHAEAARRIRWGLIAEDLPEQMPAVLAALHAEIGPQDSTANQWRNPDAL